MASRSDSHHAVHVAQKVTELALSSPQGHAAVAAATGMVVAAAPVVVPVAVTAAVGYGVYRGICKLGELLDG